MCSQLSIFIVSGNKVIMRCFYIKGKLSIHTEGVSLRWGTGDQIVEDVIAFLCPQKQQTPCQEYYCLLSFYDCTAVLPSLVVPADARAKNKRQPLCSWAPLIFLGGAVSVLWEAFAQEAGLLYFFNSNLNCKEKLFQSKVGVVLPQTTSTSNRLSRQENCSWVLQHTRTLNADYSPKKGQ